MKTERRHELQTNVLADTLGRWIVAVKPYTTLIVGSLVVLVIAVAAWNVLAWLASNNREAAWGEFNVARDKYVTAKRQGSSELALVEAVEDVKTVIDNNKETPVARWAELMLGNHFLGVGVDQMFNNRDKASDSLATAAGYYTDATESKEKELEQRAYFGLGKAREGQGDLEKAIKAYDAAAKAWPNGPLTETAKRYSERLKKPETREFYVWYAKQNPQRARAAEDADPLKSALEGFKFPGFDDTKPSNPDALESGPFLPKTVDPLEEEAPALPDDDASTLPEDPDTASETTKKSAE